MTDVSQSWQPSAHYAASVEHLLAAVESDSKTGLSAKVAASRLASDGPNTIGQVPQINPWLVLLDQFRSNVVVLLLVAAGISALLAEYLQTVGIGVAVLVNATVGFLTEYQARLSLQKLAGLSGSSARVRRGDQELLIPVADLVRGDLLLLEPGDRVPADARLLEAVNLSVDESTLTGESVPVWKLVRDDEHFENQTLFQGTMISSGRAKAVVVSTGRDSRLGSLAVALETIDASATPLQNELTRLGRVLAISTIVICALVVLGGLLFRGMDLLHLVQIGIALAVAAIPEGLPVVSTLALAIGIRRMVAKKALVRRLMAVETLGCTTVICTDKTGTLTENKMMVERLRTTSGQVRLTGRGYDPHGSVESIAGQPSAPELEIKELLEAAALCNDAALHEVDGVWKITGDPTEAALLVAARKVGIDLYDVSCSKRRIAELPFDLERKRMSTLHANDQTSGLWLFCKGSPESVLPLCSHISADGAEIALSDQLRASFMEGNAALADGGLRVLAVARRSFGTRTVCIDHYSLEQDLVLLGLVAMADALRPGVENAIAACKTAGVRIIMLTGDQHRTAAAIGGRLGIDAENVLARVTPEMKLSVVRRLQGENQIVGMTGDGVNDAPALKQADIGIAMGMTGSDLARDASDIVITDDNFATLVAAIEEGRAIYRNIKRAIAYLLTASIASLLVVVMGMFFSKHVLLTPLQILWLNLIMHVFPGLGLVMQRDTKNAMRQQPRSRSEHLLTAQTVTHIGVRALVVAFAAMASPVVAPVRGTLDANTLVLATVSFSLLLQSWSWLFDRSVDPRAGLSASSLINRPMLLNTGIGIILALIAIYFRPLQAVLQTSSLTMEQLVQVLGLSAISFVLSTLFLIAPSAKRQNQSSH